MGCSNGAIKTAFDIQVDGKHGLERPKMTWQQLTEKDCREWKLLVIVPHDRHIWYDIYHGAASQLPGRGPLMWMLHLYLHVNKKFDDPDDDHDHEKHHWHMVDSKSQCPPQHCFSDFFTRTKPGTG